MKKPPKTARPLGVRGHQKRSYLVASHKNGGEMFVESKHEHTTMLALDVDPRTRSIHPQPFTVRLDLEKIFPTRTEAIQAEPRRRIQAVKGPHEEWIYTPDFLVELTSPIPLVVEPKSSREIAKIGSALERRGRVLNNLGYRFLVVSSAEVEQEGLHRNLATMRDAMQYRRDNDTTQLFKHLAEIVTRHHTAFSLGAIFTQVPHEAIYLALISGVFACDLRAGPISVNTKLWPAHGDLSHLQLLNLET